jgi:hypothetical protein
MGKARHVADRRRILASSPDREQDDAPPPPQSFRPYVPRDLPAQPWLPTVEDLRRDLRARGVVERALRTCIAL